MPQGRGVTKSGASDKCHALLSKLRSAALVRHMAFRSVRERSGIYQATEIGSFVTWDVPLPDVRQKGEGRCLGLAGDDLGQHLRIGLLEPHTRERRDHLGDRRIGEL